MPPYAFGQLDEIKLDLINQGKELIDLSLGSPDRGTEPSVLEALYKGMQKRRNQQYPIFSGLPEFKDAIADWFLGRFNVKLDPKTQILPLLGSKEGIAHIAFAYMQEGHVAIIPSPYYPVHMRGTVLAGGHVYELELKPENNFVGDLDAIPEDVLLRAKMLILSYPHNPTGATVDKKYLEKAVALCKEYEILLVNDLAYSEIWFDDNKPNSIFEVEGAIDIGIDYGVCMGIQEAGAAAIALGDSYREEIRLEYQRRRDYVMLRLKEMGLKPNNPGGAMYIWIPVPEQFRGEDKDSFDFARDLLAATGVALVPGLTFGPFGKDYVRLALVQPLDKLKTAMEKLETFVKKKVVV